jgi:outer membrane protein assembly factor BamB
MEWRESGRSALAKESAKGATARASLRLLRMVAVGALVAACSDSASPSGPADGPAPSARSAFAIDSPTAGQALIAGTKLTLAWRGGDPSERVDVEFVSKTGEVAKLASNLANTGSSEIAVNLLEGHQRAGGALRITRATGGGLTPSFFGAGSVGTQDVTDGASERSPEVPVRVGSFAGFRWTGSVEEYYWINVVTGEQKTLGTVGDLQNFGFGAAAADPSRGEVYVVGSNGRETKVYVLDAKSGELVRSAPLREDANSAASTATYLGVNATDAGQLTAFRRDFAQNRELVVRIDTATGKTTVLGALSDLSAYNGSVAHAPAAGALFLVGVANDGRTKLYEVDARTGTERSSKPLVEKGAPIENLLGNIAGLQATPAGRLIGFRWNGTAQEMVSIDTSTGDTAAFSAPFDLKTWTGVAGVNATTGIAYVLGFDATEASKVYALDIASGALLFTSPVAQIPQNGVLVY